MGLDMGLASVLGEVQKEYSRTPTRLKVIDCFMVYNLATALVQVVYMALVGTFPFNGFLAGVLSSVGSCVLTACLRIQLSPDNPDFKNRRLEPLFAEYVLCTLLLHLLAVNYVG